MFGVKRITHKISEITEISDRTIAAGNQDLSRVVLEVAGISLLRVPGSQNWVARSPKKIVQKTGREPGVSIGSSRRFTKDILGLGSPEVQEIQSLDGGIKELRLKRCLSSGRQAAVLFTDEELLTIEYCFNRENDRIPASARMTGF